VRRPRLTAPEQSIEVPETEVRRGVIRIGNQRLLEPGFGFAESRPKTCAMPML
jgi:hypothetical protein